MEPKESTVTPYNLNQSTNNGSTSDNRKYDLHQIYQKPYIIPGIPKSHYLPLIHTDFVNQRLSVIRFAKSKRNMNNEEDFSMNESAPKRFKPNSSYKSGTAITIVPLSALEERGISGIVTPPASSVDFSGNEAQMSPSNSEEAPDMIILGANKSAIRNAELQLINLNSIGNCTRSLLDLLFTFEELATHSLTGKPSPAFYGRERPKKLPLDNSKIEDIIEFVQKSTGATAREIRQVITAKCADSAKKYRKHFKTEN